MNSSATERGETEMLRPLAIAALVLLACSTLLGPQADPKAQTDASCARGAGMSREALQESVGRECPG